jgi:hypothetical protein
VAPNPIGLRMGNDSKFMMRFSLSGGESIYGTLRVPGAVKAHLARRQDYPPRLQVMKRARSLRIKSDFANAGLDGDIEGDRRRPVGRVDPGIAILLQAVHSHAPQASRDRDPRAD